MSKSLLTPEERKERDRIRALKYYRDNKEQIRARRKLPEYLEKQRIYATRYRELNREKESARILAWYHANPDKLKKKDEYNKKWRAENKHIVNTHTAKRRTNKLQRMPKWLTDSDKQQIKEMYNLAKILKETTGKEWHVDHIIPLKGKNVSGLHVPSNLQIILGSENSKKNNRYKIDG